MDKEQLKVKLATLEANEKIKRDELGIATSAAQVAREELANVNKPVITEDVANDIIERVRDAFAERLSGIDSDQANVELGIEYDNTIVIESFDLDDIDMDEDSIMEILIDTFNIDHDNGEGESERARTFEDNGGNDID
jgi:hypothetical protein